MAPRAFDLNSAQMSAVKGRMRCSGTGRPMAFAILDAKNSCTTVEDALRTTCSEVSRVSFKTEEPRASAETMCRALACPVLDSRSIWCDLLSLSCATLACSSAASVLPGFGGGGGGGGGGAVASWQLFVSCPGTGGGGGGCCCCLCFCISSLLACPGKGGGGGGGGGIVCLFVCVLCLSSVSTTSSSSSSLVGAFQK